MVKCSYEKFEYSLAISPHFREKIEKYISSELILLYKDNNLENKFYVYYPYSWQNLLLWILVFDSEKISNLFTINSALRDNNKKPIKWLGYNILKQIIVRFYNWKSILEIENVLVDAKWFYDKALEKLKQEKVIKSYKKIEDKDNPNNAYKKIVLYL